MNKASSSSNMTRSTAEALKQIKKQGLLQKPGLSISIVNTDSPRPSFPSDSSVTKETRPKQNVSIDKTTRLLPRSSVTDNKSALVQGRSVPITSSETRTSVGQSAQQSNQAVYQESKIACNANKSNQPMVSTSETRAFGSQSWSNQSPGLTTENKPQGLTRASQVISVVPENKNPSVSTRLSQNASAFTENKIQTSRSSSIVHENKTPGRMGQVSLGVETKTSGNQGRSQNQALTFEGKVQTNHNRISLNSPPSEVKVLTSNQLRVNKNFSTVHDNKSSTSAYSHSLVVTESKTCNNPTKVVNRVVEVKSANMIQRNQAVKGMPAERNCQVTVKSDSRSTVDQSSGNSAMLSDRSVNNPFRVASTLPKKVSHTAEEKSLIKVTRVSQNLAFSSENQSAVHSKTSQSLTMQSESKAVSQVVKISSVSSDPPQKATASIDNSNDCPPVIYTMSSRGTTKRPQVAKISCTPVGKKRCTKRLSPNISEPSGKSQTNADACNVSSDEGSSTKEKQFFNLKGLTPGLTITPVVSSATMYNPSTSGVNKKTSEEYSTVAMCPSCKQLTSNLNSCDHCNARFTPNTFQHQKKSRGEGVPSFVVTKNVTTSIEKKIVYQFPEMIGQNQSFHFKQAVQGQVTIEGNPVIHVSPRGKGRPKRRKFVEPVCYTLSSDEEEPVPMSFNPILDEVSHAGSQLYPVESEGSKSEHSSTSDLLQDDNEEFDDPQFPGVTDINPHLEDEEEGEEVMDYDGEGLEEEEECSAEDEEVEEEEEESPHEEDPNGEEERPPPGQKPTDYPLRCRSIRIGSYKVHPKMNNACVPVVLSADSLSFQAPNLTEANKSALITIRDQDIKSVWVHFGRCLPIMFIFTTPTFGEAVRNVLNMSDKDPRYFDPTSKDDKTQKLTFLIENMTEDHRHFLRYYFPGDKKIKEMDQKTANEILVKSTPHQNLAVKLQCIQPVVPISVESQLAHTLNTPSQITATKVILPQPVVKLFTYPPPPQTGGIAITNEDLACLNEGEFLNDAIIDFYLKYVFYEKLSPAQREKTHIFSSFFYPRLTHKPERPRSGDDAAKTMQVRRHDQVKTWTRHVDIFSKDFIIIPVNQNVHWFLAIICYPGRVPDAPANTVQQEGKTNKSADNVTSTVEQEENNTNKVIIKEISSNGEGDNSNQDENSMNSNSNSPYEVEEPPDSDEPSAETPDSTTHPDVKQRRDLNMSKLVIEVFPIPKEKTMSQPCICIFDSLCGPNRWRIASTLREYLEMEWKMKKGTKKVFDRNTMQGFVMKCPQQNNYSDCGTYVLQYVESFFENPIPYFRSPMPDLTNWFTEAKINKKRQQLQDLILSLQKKLKASASTASARKSNQSDSVPSSPGTALQTENR